MKYIIRSNVVPELVRIVITESDSDVLVEACWCLLQLCTGKNKFVLYLIDNDILDALKAMSQLSNEEISISAVRTIGNWCLQSSTIRDAIMGHDIHQFLIGKLTVLTS